MMRMIEAGLMTPPGDHYARLCKHVAGVAQLTESTLNQSIWPSRLSNAQAVCKLPSD